jgi:uncharacterized oxidoreductase
MELKNSTILITGGTSGIGLEFLKQLSALGANLIITGRDEQKLMETKERFPNVTVFKSDVSNTQDVEELYAKIIHQFPSLNIIINNAGIMRRLSLEDSNIDLNSITAEIETNLSGIIKMNHLFLHHLKTKKEAAIINISSGLAFVPFLASPIYSVAKAGLHAYTQLLRLQLKNTSVKVFEIAPPSTKTPIQKEFKDMVKDNQNMSVEEMVKQSIKGIQKNNFEIKPGLAKILKMLSRIAPSFALRMVNN